MKASKFKRTRSRSDAMDEESSTKALDGKSVGRSRSVRRGVGRFVRNRSRSPLVSRVVDRWRRSGDNDDEGEDGDRDPDLDDATAATAATSATTVLPAHYRAAVGADDATPRGEDRRSTTTTTDASSPRGGGRRGRGRVRREASFRRARRIPRRNATPSPLRARATPEAVRDRLGLEGTVARRGRTDPATTTTTTTTTTKLFYSLAYGLVPDRYGDYVDRSMKEFRQRIARRAR